jgi:hypothetical protein
MLRPESIADQGDQRGGGEEDHGLGNRLIDTERPGDGFTTELSAQHRNRNADSEQHALADPDGDLAHRHARWIATRQFTSVIQLTPFWRGRIGVGNCK